MTTATFSLRVCVVFVAWCLAVTVTPFAWRLGAGKCHRALGPIAAATNSTVTVRHIFEYQHEPPQLARAQ